MTSPKRRPAQKSRRKLMHPSRPNVWRALTAVAAVTFVGGFALYAASHAAVSWTPAYSANFPDPTALYYNGQYYAYATQTSTANVPTAVSSNGINWSAGVADALPTLPAWAYSGKTWAPSVHYDIPSGKFVMFYAVLKNMPPPRMHCIGKATSSSPTGPFIDTSTAPFLCQTAIGGTIDPDVFTDSGGAHYLYVKNAGTSVGTTNSLWVQPLTSSYTLKGTLTQVLTADQTWQAGTVEGPGMVKIGGAYYLFYAGNNYATKRYAIGYATCSSPMGPCTEGPSNPWLVTSGSMLGPGSPEFFVNAAGQQQIVFAAWNGAVNTSRAMYEGTVTLSNNVPVVSPDP